MLACVQAGPADLDGAGGVIEQAEGDRDQLVGTAWLDDLDGVPARLPASETSASTGTIRTPETVAVVIDTCTGAWSRCPVAAGSDGVTSTVMTGVLEVPPLLGGVVAMVPA